MKHSNNKSSNLPKVWLAHSPNNHRASVSDWNQPGSYTLN